MRQVSNFVHVTLLGGLMYKKVISDDNFNLCDLSFLKTFMTDLFTAIFFSDFLIPFHIPGFLFNLIYKLIFGYFVKCPPAHPKDLVRGNLHLNSGN